MASKIVGKFCERKLAPKGSFDKRSFRWKRAGKPACQSWVLIGCPRGNWRPRLQRCVAGMRAYALLVASKGPTCCPRHRKGERCVVKR